MSFDTFNLFHRWFGRTVIMNALIHVSSFAAVTVSDAGWAEVKESIDTKPFMTYGFIVS